MRVRVNRRWLQLFDGATVRNAVLRYYAVRRWDVSTVDDAVVRDAYGHETDLDAPLTDGQQISVEKD